MVLDKLKFWKKDDFGLDSDPGPDPLATPDPLAQPDPLAGHDPLATANSPSFDPQAFTEGRFNEEQTGQDQYPGSASFPGSQPPLSEPEVHGSRDRDTELILAKLDMIKSELDSLHQRVRKIEQITDKRESRYW